MSNGKEVYEWAKALGVQPGDILKEGDLIYAIKGRTPQWIEGCDWAQHLKLYRPCFEPIKMSGIITQIDGTLRLLGEFPGAEKSEREKLKGHLSNLANAPDPEYFITKMCLAIYDALKGDK